MLGRCGVRDSWLVAVNANSEYLPTHDLAFNADELQFLIACVGLDFFADMATSTNLYAAHSGAGTSWYDTNEREMRFFFGLQIMMGIKQQPEYRDYWSQDPVLGDTYISSRITRNRYNQLSKCLHLIDPATEDDVCYMELKISPSFDYVF